MCDCFFFFLKQKTPKEFPLIPVAWGCGKETGTEGQTEDRGTEGQTEDRGTEGQTEDRGTEGQTGRLYTSEAADEGLGVEQGE